MKHIQKTINKDKKSTIQDRKIDLFGYKKSDENY